MGHFIVKNTAPPSSQVPHQCDLPPIYEWTTDWDNDRERKQQLFRGTIWKCNCGRFWYVTPVPYFAGKHDAWEPLPAAEARRLEEIEEVR